uniref:Uncharacterized protein n=1 Tax=Arundo donax TaxID=35708 RepID=A0A0A8YXI8_ARUDO
MMGRFLRFSVRL